MRLSVGVGTVVGVLRTSRQQCLFRSTDCTLHYGYFLAAISGPYALLSSDCTLDFVMHIGRCGGCGWWMLVGVAGVGWWMLVGVADVGGGCW